MTPDAFPLPDRTRPVHLPAGERHNRAIIYFVTVCTNGRRPVLANDQMHAVLCDAWCQATWFNVGRYVIMPDHVHLFCSPAVWPSESLTKWVNFWKSTSARSWRRVDGTKVVHPKRTDDTEVVPPLETASSPKLWQRDFWDRQLRSGDSYSEKWNYVRNNPVRVGFVAQPDDWAYWGEMETLRWHE